MGRALVWGAGVGGVFGLGLPPPDMGEPQICTGTNIRIYIQG